MFGALGAIGVNVRAIVEGASSRSISCVIDQHDTADAVRAVHDAFRFAHQRVSVVLVGKGTVGGQLLAQLSAHARELEVAHDARIRVVGVCDSTGFVFDEAGISEFDGARLVQLRVPWPAGGDVRGLLPRLARLPVPILVDCTAADGMEVVYQAAFGLGVHVVAANKKPLTTPMPVWRELQAGARRAHRAFHYETTVGASLPVIQTLQDLVRTGDEVELIEGAFSGTLGFLATELMKGVPLSQAVRTAKELGYTEPHPRDDLSGTDAARKALILARELGLNLEMGQVEVRPFVPAEVLQHEDLDVFFSELQSLDAEVAAQVERLRREGRVLRYLARVERPGRLVVGPVEVEAGHPAASLRGAEGFVSFTTARYREYPLIVRGAGAGGSVTAAGVLADVLRIARHLRGG
jgi:aspartokinase/homoserine dehydrogenase 1